MKPGKTGYTISTVNTDMMKLNIQTRKSRFNAVPTQTRESRFNAVPISWLLLQEINYFAGIRFLRKSLSEIITREFTVGQLLLLPLACGLICALCTVTLSGITLIPVD
jgi:hypothetical protein